MTSQSKLGQRTRYIPIRFSVCQLIGVISICAIWIGYEVLKVDSTHYEEECPLPKFLTKNCATDVAESFVKIAGDSIRAVQSQPHYRVASGRCDPPSPTARSSRQPCGSFAHTRGGSRRLQAIRRSRSDRSTRTNLCVHCFGAAWRTARPTRPT